MRMAQIQEIIKLNASLPFFDVLELIEDVFGQSSIKHHFQWKRIYDNYRGGKELKCRIRGKREPYYTNEDDYGKSYRVYNSADEVTDFTENCKLSFSERLKITQLYL
jgi:hypothetical protein